MNRFILYALPAIFDIAMGIFFFISTVRMADSGASAAAVSSVFTIWGCAYMVSSYLIGRYMNARNVTWFMLTACICLTLNSIGSIVFSRLEILYILTALQGIVVALFFPPFILFMKGFEAGYKQDLSRSTALYTFSWSLGFGVGPFVAGFVWVSMGWKWCYVINSIIGIGVIGGVLWLRRHMLLRKVSEPQEVTNANGAQLPPAKIRDFAWLGWVGSGTSLLVVAVVRAVFPTSAVASAISKPDQGIILGFLCLGQALAGLLVSYSKTWMYRAIPVGLFGFVGLAGAVLFGFSHSVHVLYLAGFMVGLYTGAAFIYLAYHALVHPSRAGKNVGINEAVVGLTGIIGPAFGGLIADTIGLAAPFWIVSIAAFCAVFLQCTMHLRFPLASHKLVA
jgi:MFS family permease